MRNLNLDQIQTLIAIADLGTFAAASQALHLAPPTISLHIKELEARMQVPLVLRGRRQAGLTAAGQALVEEGRKLLAASDDLVDIVRRRAAGSVGVVKVGVSAGVGIRLLPLVLEALGRRAPGVDVKLEAAGSAEAMLRLQGGTLDVAIVASPQPATARVAVTPWRDDEMVALLPASWEAPEAVTPEWLSTRRWACFAPGTQMHGLIASWFGQAGFNPRPFLALSYPGALKGLAAASQSAAILPLAEVEDAGHADVQWRALSPPLRRPMALAYRAAPEPGAAAAAVLEALAAFSTA
ncbi:LysR family transcriptional regulator [Achromobacter sp. 413638]|uniref:LysR family transcriptional regulator n=1 Tax=Achromobacter sp. 413638 TaxID=3342385 RepID=UPI00370B9261